MAGLALRGFTIAAGYGKLKDTSIRIGHMGDHTPDELEVVLAELADVLVPAGSRPVAAGAGDPEERRIG